MSGQISGPVRVYVGTYTQDMPHAASRAEGIYVYELDPASGALSHVQTAPGVANPSFLALDPPRQRLYAVNEVVDIDGRKGGAVSAFAVDEATGALTYLNRQPTRGEDPCHLSVDRTGRYVLAANYTGGSVAVLPIESGGRLGPPSEFIQHVGSSVDSERQQEAHAHSITVDPNNRFALVADLGLDQILVYRLDLERGRLIPNDDPGVRSAPGAGPRHLEFHPNGRFVYVINEIGSTLTAYSWDGARGTLREIQSVPTLPPGFAGTNHTADVHLDPTGRFVYGSNRGHDSIVIFAVDRETGRLSYVGHEATRGRDPRNFAVDPTGSFLLAANQSTDTVVTFRIDPASGKLTAGPVADVSTPVCLKIVPSGG